MELNSFLFPAPPSSYSVHGSIGDILYIPKQFKIEKESSDIDKIREQSEVIPCIYLPYIQGSSKLLIYFHGNAEDIGLAVELLDYVRTLLRVNVLAVEYPGYGIYDGYPDAITIQQDAEIVYDYLTQVQGIPQSSIILFGRSIGTGPATYLASVKEPSALLLMSAFTSIRDVLKETAGKHLQYIISDRFRNVDLIQKVRCPTFIVHGQRDTLISFYQAKELHEKCGGPSALIIPKDMDHNEFDFIDDLIQPFYFFLKQCNIQVEPDQGNNKYFKFPESLYVPPPNFPQENRNINIWNWVIRKFM